MKEPFGEKNIRIDYMPSINYCTSRCGGKYINTFELTNDDESNWREVTVTISGDMLIDSESRIDLIPAGETVALDGLKIDPDIDRLRAITESIDTRFDLSVKIGEEEVFQTSYPIRIMPFDQWPGINIMPEMLAAFVTPNASCLAQVKIDTAQVLGRLTGDNSLNAYQTQDPNRVRKMVAAVYEALHNSGFVYIAPPPSFENNGQRIRMADQLLSQKQGTCADLSILMASCLEGIGLHPLLFLTDGHMFVGCWLEDKYYPQMFCDDVSFISKSIADGVSEIVVVEATHLTNAGVSFEAAVKSAEDRIRLKPDEFITAVDVFRCRLFGIRPMPTSAEEEGELTGVDNGDVATDVRDVRQYGLDDTGERQITRQQIWERKLLDFSLRNNLINMRIGKSVVPFVSFNINTLEDKLQEKVDFKMLPVPAEHSVTPNNDGIYNSAAFRDKMESIVLEGMKNGMIYSFLEEEDLVNSLKNLYRSSRTALEENGANTLYMVFGLLKWYETTISVKPRYAPLILEPVDIVRKSGNNYVLRLREDEITFNTTLIEMLKQQFNIDISAVTPLPTDQSGIDVCKVFSILRNIIKDQARWDVVEENLLGIFSFSKFVMWNDIHNNADKMCENPIIASLLQNRLVDIPAASDTDVRMLDRTVEPDDFAIPVDVDSSQLKAVIESGEGRSFILYGPPGTGKSQTITNMIANALYHDRRVLFVAEKMAALEVVQKRLAKIGLDPFCLEMHSNKITKSHLLTQLQQAIELTRIKSPEEYKQESEKLFAQRSQLIKYIDLLHSGQPSGLSLYDYISRYTAIDNTDSLEPDAALIQGITADDINHIVEDLNLLGAVFRTTGHPTQNRLFGLYIHEVANIESRVNTFLRRMVGALPNAVNTLRQLGEINGLDIPETLAGSLLAEKIHKVITDAPHINQALINVVRDPELTREWQYHINSGQQLVKTRFNITQKYAPEVLDIDLLGLKRDWAEACDKWIISRHFAKKKVLRFLRAYRTDISYDDITPLIQQIEEYRKTEAALARHRDDAQQVFGTMAARGHEQWGKMRDCLSAAVQVMRLFEVSGLQVDYDKLDVNATREVRTNSLKELNETMDEAKSYCTVDPAIPLSDLILKGNSWLLNLTHLRNWAQWCIRRDNLLAAHLGNVVEFIESGHSHEEARDAMLRGLYRKLAVDVIDGNEDLRIFNGMIFEDAIERYRTIAKQFQELTKRALYCKLASRIPSLTIEAANNSEIGILKRYIASGGRGTSIRHIIEQTPNLLPKLCPCLLMSPISVAQFIDLSQEKFDIVIFDEASQMPTSEAVGSIARGKALIVVGDPKQMPPTSFFTTTAVDESEADIDDMESILDDCITLSFPEHYLTWHYRSRHESLIAFSNSQYYDGRLYTFPSVDDRTSKVTFIPIKGTYDMGKSRRNREEAEAIVKEVIRRLSDSQLRQKSIGIVSFSKTQQDLIEDILVEQLSKSPKLEKLAYDCEEPIFVKNLENVQGDERDVILFSVGYGPDKNGRVSMNFGPLNNQGGERRLNVAVSRARNEMMVFSTLQPEQIDLNRSHARGVEGLKRFLEFAKSGRMPMLQGQIEESTDTSVIDAIAKAIREHGYEVDTLVGRSHFKIDLAVIDPESSDNYLMGILCDGQKYYATPSQRDREICQPGVLKGLGWNLMRVWAIDWLMNREGVIERIINQIEQLIAKKKEQPAPVEEPAPEEPAPADIPAPAVGQTSATGQASTTTGQASTTTRQASTTGQPQDPAKVKISEAPSSAGRRQTVAGTNIPFHINEEDILVIDDNKEDPYVQTAIPQRYTDKTSQVLAMARRTIEADIQKVISDEQPITLGTLRQRIMYVYGQSRTSDRLEFLLEQMIKKVYKDPLSAEGNPTLWLNAQAANGYDRYRKASGRSIEDIPLVEIRNVVRLAVRQQLSIPTEDLLRQVVRLLGFTRRTPKTDEAVSSVIDVLVQNGEILRDGAVVTLKE